MSTLSEIRKIAKANGTELVKDQGPRKDGHFEVILPKGKIWNANGCHVLSSAFGPYPSKQEFEECYKDILERMKYGIGECDGTDESYGPDGKCEHCHPEWHLEEEE